MKREYCRLCFKIIKGGRLTLGLVPLLVWLMVRPSVAGWGDWLDTADTIMQEVRSPTDGSGASLLSSESITQGLKEALQIGVKAAIRQLGQQDGFLGDQDVRIPLPDRLQQVDRLLVSMGQEQIRDQFVTSMNRAAEQAVPEVVDIFTDAVTQMSLVDAKNILQGPDDAATEYFKEHTSDLLRQLVRPHVKQAMDEAQVSHYYHLLVGTVQKYDSMGLLNQYLGQASDLDGYVTEKALTGLFTKIAEQEKLIRDDPAARSTDILRQVFGSLN